MKAWIYAVAAAAVGIAIGFAYWIYRRGHDDAVTTLHHETLRPAR